MAFLLLLYAVKSLTIFIPIIIMHIAGGFMFSTLLALIVNITGTAISLTSPYIVGRISGSDLVDRINRKFPKLEKTINNTQGSNFFLCFILRSVSCLPGDAISMFMGARRMPFQTYFWGSLSGTILSIITATLIGSSIANPSSPMFWISVGLTV